MDWSRLGLSLVPLWPAALAWLLIVMPSMAWNAHKLRDPAHPFAPLSRSLLALIWLSDHTWPYTKLARCSLAWDAYEQRALECRLQEERELEDAAIQLDLSLLTGVVSIPSRLELGLPPRSQAEAEAWLDARTRHGGTSSE